METFLRASFRTIHWIGVANVLALSLLAIAFASMVFGVQTSIKGLEAWPLLAISLTGIIFGWLIAGARIKGWLAACLALFVGGSIVALGIGRLARQLSKFIIAAAGWFWQIFHLGPFNPKDFTVIERPALYQTWSGLVLAGKTTGERATVWFQAFATGRPIYDPLSVMLVWGLIAWGAAVWAAWWIRRRQHPLLALAPCGIVLTINLAYSGSAIYTLILWIGAAVCLQAIGSYFHWEHDWRVLRLDRVDIEGDWSLTVGFIALVLMSMAVFAPSISIQKIVERIEQATSPQIQSGNNLAQALGIRQRVKVATEPLDLARNPGLPNEHLIGSGPELSKDVVMWVKLAGYNPMPSEMLQVRPDLAPPRYYWRGATYDRYTGKGWTSTPQSTKTYSSGHSISDQLFWWAGAPYQMIHQDIQMKNDQGGLLFAAGELLQASKEYKVAWHGIWDMFGAQVETGKYTVDSRLAQPSTGQLSLANQDYPDWVLRTYLAVPETVPSRVWELALDLTASLPTPYAKSVAIESYLRKFPYTLDIGLPPSDRDIVDYFLFDLKRGYCDYYASAMVILARAAGLPARLVTGYASGAYVPEEARFVVTQADAHAWAEIYFPGYGWAEFEPTAGQPSIKRPESLDQQAAQINPPTYLPSPSSMPINQTQRIILGVMIAFSVGLLFLAAWGIADRLRLGWLTPPKTIILLYDRLYRRGRSFITQSPPGDTPHEFAAHLSQGLTALLPFRSQPWAMERIVEKVRRLVDAYSRVIYSPYPAGETDKNAAIQDWQNLRFTLWRARLRKLLFPNKRGKQK